MDGFRAKLMAVAALACLFIQASCALLPIGHTRSLVWHVDCKDGLIKRSGRKEDSFGCQSDIYTKKNVPVQRSLRQLPPKRPNSPLRNGPLHWSLRFPPPPKQLPPKTPHSPVRSPPPPKQLPSKRPHSPVRSPPPPKQLPPKKPHSPVRSSPPPKQLPPKRPHSPVRNVRPHYRSPPPPK